MLSSSLFYRNEEILKSGVVTEQKAQEMEPYIFEKARTKEEYLGYSARLILYIREKSSKYSTILLYSI